MNQEKKQYLNTIRANTAYPTYRSVIGISAGLGYLLGVLFALGALIGGFSLMTYSLPAGVGVISGGAIISALTFVQVAFWMEAALMLTDIADSITDTNSRASH